MHNVVGRLVILYGHHKLFAKVVAQCGKTSTVEFFNSVTNREKKDVPNFDLSPLQLPRQTRVFFKSSYDKWEVGRVEDSIRRDDGAFVYEVRFPNQSTKEIIETELYVRSLGTFADPADILASGCAETQFFSDRRRPALRRIRHLRSAAHGLTGLVSAAIELVPHQVGAARRVLQDSIQRYLLADEVGLGKTVEAGIVIRQTLIDDPSRRVVVLTPSPLTEQWLEELEGRFRVAEFPNAVQVHRHDEIANLAGEEIDLLVVDEAHHLVVPAGSTQDDKHYTFLRELARDVDRLLLLSATPAFGDEDRLLALLNLLDPANHPIEDRNGFRRKLEERQQIGRVLLPLRTGRPLVVLRSQAQQAASTFPDDPVVRTEAERIQEGGNDRAKVDAAVESLRDHITRTYRLHERLIRTRRKDANFWFVPRGPEWPQLRHVRLEFEDEARPEGIAGLLESWRLEALTTDRHLNSTLCDRYMDLVAAAWRGPRALLTVLEGIQSQFPSETYHLNALSDWASNPDRDRQRLAAVRSALENLRAELRADHPSSSVKIACFASDPEEANALTDGLHSAFGPFDVAYVTQAAGRDTATAAVEAFRTDPQAWVLVCDRTGEEGLNLQFVHGIVHVDTPLSAGRVEQRIGRLDRFGRTLGDIRHRIVLPDDDEDAPWRVWFNLLANGFRVFNRSVSDVQFRLEKIETRIAKRLFNDGTIAVQDEEETISEELSTERQKLDEQHALDHLAALGHDATDLIDQIDESEEDESAIAKDVAPWVKSVIGLTLNRIREKKGDIVTCYWNKNTLLPSFPWKNAFDPALAVASTWSRRRASTVRGKPPSLLRPGSPLFAALERVARWDDRGVAYATWRVEPGFAEMFRGFRLVWVVEPELEVEGPIWKRGVGEGLRRRAQAFLPPVTYEQLLDESGRSVSNPDLLTILGREYNTRCDAVGRFDVNLGSRPQAIAQAMDPALLREVIANVRSAGEMLLRNDPNFEERREQALNQCRREAFRARRSLEQQSALYHAAHSMDLPEFDQAVSALDRLDAAIQAPRVRLDEIGFLVVSGEAPT